MEEQQKEYPAYPPIAPSIGGNELLDGSAVQYYLQLLRRRIWIIVPVVVICATFGLLRAFRATDYYRATAKLIVERQAPRVVGVDNVPQDLSFFDQDFYITQAELATTKDVLEPATRNPTIAAMFPTNSPVIVKRSFLAEVKRTLVSLLGAVPLPPPEPWEVLRGMVNVSHQKDTYFILISSQGGDGARAARLANAVAASFADYHVRRRKDMLGDAGDFLQEEKDKQEKLLNQAQKDLQAFREEAKEITRDSSGAAQPVQKRLSDLSEKLTQVQLERIELQAALGVIRQVIEEEKGSNARTERLFALSNIRMNALVSKAHGDVTDARQNKERLAEVYGPDHPLMKEADAEENRLNREFKYMLAQEVLSLENKSRFLVNQEEALKTDFEIQKKAALELSKEDFVFSQLENATKRHQKLYDTLVEKLQEVDLSSNFVRTNARVVETASTPSSPAGPNRKRMILMWLLIGMAGGVGLALVVEHVDDTIKTPEDLKDRVGVALLGFVPHIDRQPEDKADKEWYRKVGAVSVLEPMSSAAEAYRNIRTRVLFASPADERTILGFTSSNPGEGKTTTASNMALVMASVGKKVLLIDADLHRPVVHQIFGIEESPGLTDILARGLSLGDTVRRCELGVNKPEGTLDLLVAGTESPSPAELLGSKRMKELLAEAKAHYDWVFIDMPPVLFVSDASIVSAICEGVVLVVRAGENNRSVLVRTKEQIEEVRAHILGCILNNVTLGLFGRYYSDYSYYGYSKYSKKYHKSYYSKDRDKK